jgi:hypothetical protein
MFADAGGNGDVLQSLIDGNTIAGAGLSMAAAAEALRLKGTQPISRYTSRGVHLYTPGGPRRFLPWINPNGGFVSGVKTAGTALGVVGTGVDYAFAIDSAIAGDTAGAVEHGIDGTIGLIGVTASNPWTMAASGAYLGGKAIGGHLGRAAVRDLVAEQLPGAQFVVRKATETLNGMKDRYESGCK